MPRDTGICNAFSFLESAVDQLWDAGRKQAGFPGYLCGLAVGKERDLGKWVRESIAVSCDKAPGLVHVRSQLKDMPVCGQTGESAGISGLLGTVSARGCP